MTATLADQQTERERLRAETAKADYDAAMAETCAAEALSGAALAVRAVLADACASLAERWLAAIAGASDETQVHYLMSDAAHDWLAQTGEAAERASAALPQFGKWLRQAAKPRDLLTVSEWADRHRWLKTGTNAPGRWSTALTPYLREIQDSLSEHSPVRTVVFIKSSGVGGPLDLATPIPTPNGWTTMGEIQCGDRVFAENGAPCNVTFVSPIFEGRRCFEMKFSDGATIICDDSHRWVVDDLFPGHAGKKRGERRLQANKTTAEIAATFIDKGRRRYAIPVCGALELPEAELPFPPYALGYWLANGNLSGNQMTAHDDDAVEIAEHLTASGSKATARKLPTSKGRAANIILATPAKTHGECRRGHVLEKVGSFKNKAGSVCCRECHRQHAMHYKYGNPVDPVLDDPGFMSKIKSLGIRSKNNIPQLYLRASRRQRAELLQGMMDGDGSITLGRCEFSTVSETMAADFMELAYSLGLKPSCYTAPRRGFSGSVAPEVGTHYRVSFVAYDDTPVFKLRRKLERQTARSASNPSITLRRFIVDVRPVPSRPVRCIAVDSESHLYLCGREMIPTHNTEALYNWLGYTMHHLQNKDLLVVVPTLELRDRSFNPRLTKMLAETDCLAGLVGTGSRSKVNRGDLLEYGARARLIRAGANSPDSLRSDHLPYVICDEVDAFPWDVGGEGDPMTLIENRQRTFSRAKTYLVSTPTLAGQSRIDQMYRRSDMRRYHVPCPHCGEFQILAWPHLKYRTELAAAADGMEHIKQVSAAWYECQHCGASIDEGHKPEMLAGGRWIAQRPHIKAMRGYHLNALYAPVGLGLNWRAIAQKWLNSQGDSAEMKGFVNTYLGEVWQEQGDGIEELSLISRLEDYRPGALPLLARVAGVDVQKDRLEISIVGFGDGEEAWLLEHIILPGETATPEIWAELHDVLTERRVHFAAIDSGYNTSMVYAFCAERRWAVAIKGLPGIGRPLVEDEKKRRQRLRTRRKKGVQVEPLGVDQGKALIYARLKLPRPGHGYIHFPRDGDFDDEYFAQLGAERLVTRMRGMRPIQEWVRLRPRNEALDCLVYALAAYRLMPPGAAAGAGGGINLSEWKRG